MSFDGVVNNENRDKLLRERLYIKVPFICGNSLECEGTYTTTEGKWDIKCSGGKQEITCLDKENKTTYRRLEDTKLLEVQCIGQTKLIMYLTENQMKKSVNNNLHIYANIL